MSIPIWIKSEYVTLATLLSFVWRVLSPPKNQRVSRPALWFPIRGVYHISFIRQYSSFIRQYSFYFSISEAETILLTTATNLSPYTDLSLLLLSLRCNQLQAHIKSRSCFSAAGLSFCKFPKQLDFSAANKYLNVMIFILKQHFKGQEIVLYY